LGTRFGFAALPAAGVVAAEPDADLSVVDDGPATAPEVSDVETFDDDACVVEPAVLLFAAEAEFVPLPLHAKTAAARTIEMRADRYIFPSLFRNLREDAGKAFSAD